MYRSFERMWNLVFNFVGGTDGDSFENWVLKRIFWPERD
jgi:hypothetical protein